MKRVPITGVFPDSLAMSNHMDALFSGDKNQITTTFNQFKPLIKEYICYEVWKTKGSIHGIHNDFGRHSYL